MDLFHTVWQWNDFCAIVFLDSMDALHFLKTLIA